MPLKLILVAVVSASIGLYAGQFLAENDQIAESQGVLPAISATSTQYVCPMHGEIISHEPGSCPICRMDLVEKRLEHADHHDDAFPAVTIFPNVQHNLGIRTDRVKRGDLPRHVETLGKITRLDPTARRIIHPPVAGKLVYLADKEQGDDVVQGELLFSILSPDAIELQTQFQAAFNNDSMSLVTEMIPELRDIGLTPAQIAELQAGTAPDLPVHVYSEEAGVVFSRRGKVGDEIPTGFTVFNLGGNYQLVEVTAEIFEREWSRVEEKQAATMTVRGLPGRIFHGEVVRVEPPVGYTTRSLEIRLKFKTNDPGISQSMFAHINIKGKTRKNLLLLPRDAVIRTGEGDHVIVARKNNVFKPLPVVVGEESMGMIEIISGLKEGGQVVVSGQFLIDSESNMSASFKRMSDL